MSDPTWCGVKTVEFAAGEMSNAVWGFFQRKK